MKHHQELHGMKIIIVVCMMLSICIIFGCQSQRNGRKCLKIQMSIFLHCTMDSKNIDTLEAEYDHVQTLLHNNDPLLFPYGHMGISDSALAS